MPSKIQQIILTIASYVIAFVGVMPVDRQGEYFESGVLAKFRLPLSVLGWTLFYVLAGKAMYKFGGDLCNKKIDGYDAWTFFAGVLGWFLWLYLLADVLHGGICLQVIFALAYFSQGQNDFSTFLYGNYSDSTSSLLSE